MGSSNEMEQVDLIDRQAAIDLLKQMRKDGDMIPWEGKDVFARIRKLPSAQLDLDSAYTEGYTAAESKYRKMWDEIVHCKDCIHWKERLPVCNRVRQPGYGVNDFCSKGERRTDERI